ncbi:MAG: sodium:proton antiporter [Chloroflexi bacterium]|nr:sodium:proton antiporter [Chloroflexota bacterium]
METQGLLATLVIASLAALLGGALAARLGQSVIIGYILAGVAIGPFTPGPVGDITTVQALADIGVIFLMFAIGVQLSLRNLLSAGRIAIAGASIQLVTTIGIGYWAALSLGWTPLEAIFLGAVIAISSSVVMTKVLAERAETDTTHGRIAIAWSTVQDLATVVLMIVLTALSAAGANVGGDLLWAAVKSAVFLGLVVPLGYIVLPRLFQQIAALRNREVFVLAIGAVALGTAFGATFFGLSVALGAFIAGIVVSESDLSHQILGEIAPLRDIFAGLFFVSVGMLANPLYVAENLALVLVGILLIVVVKGAISGLIIALARCPIRTAILGGILLGQSAEFSFLLARLGADLGAISSGSFSLMLTAAVVSIVLSPPLYGAFAGRLSRVDMRLPLSDAPRQAQPMPADPPRGHAVLCGYGRVGGVIGAALLRRGFRIFVIEENHAVVRRLRADGVPALLGNAANRVLLDQTNLKDARLLIVAIPDPLAARQVVDHARAVNARLDIVVRTHTGEQAAFMRSRGVAETVMGETELALEMTRHALRRFGVSAAEAQAAIGRLRDRLSAGETVEER